MFEIVTKNLSYTGLSQSRRSDDLDDTIHVVVVT